MIEFGSLGVVENFTTGEEYVLARASVLGSGRVDEVVGICGDGEVYRWLFEEPMHGLAKTTDVFVQQMTKELGL